MGFVVLRDWREGRRCCFELMANLQAAAVSWLALEDRAMDSASLLSLLNVCKINGAAEIDIILISNK